MILHYPDVTLIMEKTSWRRHLGDSHRRFYLDVTPARMAILLLYIYIYPAKYCRLARLPSRIIIGRLPDLLRCLHSIHLFWYTWKDLLVYTCVTRHTDCDLVSIAALPATFSMLFSLFWFPWLFKLRSVYFMFGQIVNCCRHSIHSWMVNPIPTI